MEVGQEEDKSMMPLFPRLHLNNADKRGPRAPPRNKMVLYERHNVPSQRFGQPSSAMPLPHHNASLPIPSNSSSQAGLHERDFLSLFRMPVSTPVLPSEIVDSWSSSMINHHSRKGDRPLNGLNYGNSSIMDLLQQQSFNCSYEKKLNQASYFGAPTFIQNGDHSQWRLRAITLYNSNSDKSVKENGFLGIGDSDRNNETSQVSTEDPKYGLEIGPDKLTCLIGEQQFWKIQRVIINQQRVFTFQVAELHRLTKVQKWFAGSAHLLLEENPYLSKSSVKAPLKIPLLDSNSIAQQDAMKQKDDQRKPYSKSDSHQNPWYFHPQLNRWLVPIVSPSEGLVYKPCTGYCAPSGVPPVARGFVNTTFSVPAVTSIKSYTWSSCNMSLSRSEAITSCSLPSSGAITSCSKELQASKITELQGSSASNPHEETLIEARQTMTLFPVAAFEGPLSCSSESNGQECQTRPIKPVPYKASSVSASILQSTQAKRQKQDS
ncbi:protein EARLY FLOWERING 3-like isoform X2 [Curcuma longa]